MQIIYLLPSNTSDRPDMQKVVLILKSIISPQQSNDDLNDRYK